MIKKILKTSFFLLFLGCETLPTIPSFDNFSNGGTEAQSKIASSIDSENEVYAIGSSSISNSGSLIAIGKASSDAKEILRKKIIKEEEIFFNSFIINSDTYTKKIFTSVIPDLREYAANNLVQKAVKKDTWNEGDKVFVIYAIDKNEIINESKIVFASYLEDLTNKFQTIKNEISQ